MTQNNDTTLQTQTALKDPIIFTASKPKTLRQRVPPPDRGKAYHITLTLPERSPPRKASVRSQ